jgi:hypothetical protein
MKLGQIPNTDDLLTRQLSGNPLAWAVSLIGLGTLFFLHTTLGVQLPMRKLLPILLIGLGAYWLINYIQRHRRNQDSVLTSSYQSELPSSVLDEPTYSSVNVARFRSSK